MTLYLQIIGICGIYNIEECGLRDRALIILCYSSSSIYELGICGMRIKRTDNVRNVVMARYNNNSFLNKLFCIEEYKSYAITVRNFYE